MSNPNQGQGRRAGRGVRGRGRGNEQPPQPQQLVKQVQSLSITTPETQRHSPESGNGDNGNGGNGFSQRGRAGYRRVRDDQIVTRPPNIERIAPNAEGPSLRLVTNYFRLILSPSVNVFQYHVDFDPQCEFTRLRRKLILDNKNLFNDAYVFDGQSVIMSTTELPELTERIGVRDYDSAQIRMKIKKTRVINPNQDEDLTELIRFYNTQMRNNMLLLNYFPMDRHMYSAENKIVIPDHNLELWAGMITAINKHDAGILLCCNPTYKAVRQDSVRQVLQNLHRRSQEYRQDFQKLAFEELIGSIVITRYNNRTYRIEDIDWKEKPSHPMPPKKDRSYIDYYKQQYNINIQDHNQPMLIAKLSKSDQMRQSRRPDSAPLVAPHLVPELCFMTGLSQSIRGDERLKRAIADQTRTSAGQRLQTLRHFIQSISNNPKVQQELTRWGTKYDNNVLQLSGRLLAAERVRTGAKPNPDITLDQKDTDFAKIFRGPLYQTKNLEKWTLIYPGDGGRGPSPRELAGKFVEALIKVSRGMGCSVANPMHKIIQNTRVMTYINECKTVDPRANQMVVILVPDKSLDRYSAIKKWFCCDSPLLSQVVVLRNLGNPRGLMSIVTKIGVQMFCKFGVEPWILNIPPKDLLVIGYDTYHDTQADGGARRSVGGFVSSINPNLTKWYSRIAFHKSAEEMSNNFQINVTQSLRKYYEMNNRLPGRIIVYRDGVGIGQVEHIKDIELRDVRRAISDVCNDRGVDTIKLTFMIVSKRINTRFFLIDQRGESCNPPSGAIIDHTVTQPNLRYEFYLISQTVRQGTVTPTNFNIIWDESEWTLKLHQMLAYKLTHLYYNWPGTIRVPAPCQYAHKLAFLTGTSLHREPSEHISNTLYYL